MGMKIVAIRIMVAQLFLVSYLCRCLHTLLIRPNLNSPWCTWVFTAAVKKGVGVGIKGVGVVRATRALRRVRQRCDSKDPDQLVGVETKGSECRILSTWRGFRPIREQDLGNMALNPCVDFLGTGSEFSELGVHSRSVYLKTRLRKWRHHLPGENRQCF